MQRKIWLFFLCLVWFVFLGSVPVILQGYTADSSQDSSQLTLERIFSAKEFTVPRFGPAHWLKHKRGYTTLETSTKIDGQDIVRYDPVLNKGIVEIAASLLVPAGQQKPLVIEDYHWSNNGQWLLIFTNTKRVWRQNTRGDYWVLNLQNHQLWQLGMGLPEASLMFAKFSPDNNRVAYVSKNNLYIQELAEQPEKRQILQLTTDGSTKVINGTSDWVYEEEFDLRDGFCWSADGQYIAYWQFDVTGIRDFFMINNTDTLYPEIIPVQYPKVGTVNSACKVGVIAVTGGSTRWFEFPENSRDFYIPRMQWAANSQEIVFQRLNRLQNTNQVWLGNIKTGALTAVFTDKDEAWLKVNEDFAWLKQGKYFTWLSERDGWSHIYVVSRSGREVRLITPGNYDVAEIVGIDDEGGYVYYIASPENPTQRYLFRARLDGRGQAQRLTPKNLPGVHTYELSADYKFAIHRYSTANTPQQTDLIRLPEHTVVRSLVDTAAVEEKLKALARQPVEFFRVDIGNGVLLDALCLKPADFDPQKKYPVLFYVYGEPQGQTVRDSWGGDTYLWHLLLTQKGYIVMSVDNRGTPSLRGRTWRKCIYRQVGILASADQAAAVEAIIKDRPYVDRNRIGIWGWSGGGSMTLNMMFRYPELYRTGMAVAPVPDQLLYDSVYQERFMGLPDDNKDGYKNGSPIHFAHQLKGNLLIVHGTGDDNVHYQGTERLINELIAADKVFSMMAYPNRSHSIYEGKNTSLHLRRILTQYLIVHLPAGPLSQ